MSLDTNNDGYCDICGEPIGNQCECEKNNQKAESPWEEEDDCYLEEE